MTFGYVSSENQFLSLDEQRLKIEEWSRENKIAVEKIICDDQLSGSLQKNDSLIVATIGVFGNSVKNALEQISELLKKEVKIYCVGWENPLEGIEMARAFAITLEAFYSIVTNSTRAGIKRARSEGRVGGRKPGQKPMKIKLTGHEEEIKKMLEEGCSKCFIARKLNVSWNTVDSFVKQKLR